MKKEKRVFFMKHRVEPKGSMQNAKVQSHFIFRKGSTA